MPRHIEDITYWSGLAITGSITGSATLGYLQTAKWDELVLTLGWNVSVAVNGVFKLRATNDPATVAGGSFLGATSDYLQPLASDVYTTAAGISVAGGGITFTAVAAAGACNIILAKNLLPAVLRPEWAFTSGGTGGNSISLFVRAKGRL